jgi:hypothetical protein
VEASAEPVRVEFYSGSKAEEVPRAVWIGAERVDIVRLVEERLEETHPERIRRRRLLVETAGGERWSLIHDGATATWWLERSGR